MTADLKPWQHGVPMETLKEIEELYGHYNSFALSPFAEMNKAAIAAAMHDHSLKIYKTADGTAALQVKRQRMNDAPITMYPGTAIALKYKGDCIFSKLAGNRNILRDVLKAYGSTCWLYVWAEDRDAVAFADECGFSRVGCKITAAGEIYGVYGRNVSPSRILRLDDAERVALKRLIDVPRELVDEIDAKLDELPAFADHYSTYNKRHTWSALAVRGYSPDPAFISKPEEMTDKWQAEHAGETFALQWTAIAEQMGAAAILAGCLGKDVHRIRLMKLEPGGGELRRHTDQCDTGGAVGQLARIHVPIRTNPGVLFTAWDVYGRKHTVNMERGQCWFLDTRKPHHAINGGQTARVHLVVDVVVEPPLNAQILSDA